jgi:hypothetical protein
MKPMSARIPTALLGFSLLLACQQEKVQGIQPALSVDPTALKFALIPYGTTAVQTVTLSAISSANLTVTPTLAGSGAAAYSLSATGATNILGLQSLALEVTFAPLLPSPIPTAVQTFAATLTIASNDPDHPTTTVTISGSAQAPQLDVCWNQPPPVCLSAGPLTIELGSLPPRSADGGVVEVDIENLAQVPLTVTELQLDSAAQAAGYSIEEAVKLPITLSPASGLTDLLHIKLTPVSSGPAQGTLLVTSDDPRAGGQPVHATLDATVQPFLPPVACLGISEIDYITGQAATVDPTQPLSAQLSITPPGPLDSVVITANVSPTCSLDPQDGKNLAYQFGLAPPTGSSAQLSAVAGHPEEQRVQFDLAGLYDTSVKVTDSDGKTATASLDIPVTPQDDIEAQLVWPGVNQVDLDLHLVRQLGDGGTAGSIDDPQNDCFYCNCLLAVNYPSSSSPCSALGQYPIVLHWGASASLTIGNPLLVASQDFQPFPTENLDDVRMTGPQPGANYGLYASYYKAYQPAGTCAHDSDCTADGGNLTCSAGGECVPPGGATLQIYVDGQNISDTLFDGGLRLSASLGKPCDLWYAGEIHWISGGHFSDGGLAPPVYAFTPGPADGGVAYNASPGIGVLGISCLAQ